MLKVLEGISFEKLLPKNSGFDNSFIKTTSFALKADPIHYMYLAKSVPLLAFVVYEKNRKIISPEFYPFYNFFWLESSLSQVKINNILQESLSFLIKTHSSIKMILPIHVQDIRTLQWTNFNISIRYTYLKNLKFTDYKYEIKRNHIRAVEELGLKFTIDELNDSTWEFHSRQLKNLGFSNHKLAQLKIWVCELSVKDLIKICEIKDENNRYLGSGLILLENSIERANLLLVHTVKNSHQSKITAYLYCEIHSWLRKSGYQDIDYLGANTEDIANYKSKYNPILRTYFVVNYKRVSFNNILKSLKSVLKY